jgi:hypothetical protein
MFFSIQFKNGVNYVKKDIRSNTILILVLNREIASSSASRNPRTDSAFY